MCRCTAVRISRAAAIDATEKRRPALGVANGVVYHLNMSRFFRRYSPWMWAFLAFALTVKVLIILAVFG